MMREPFYDSEWVIFNGGIIGQFLMAKGLKGSKLENAEIAETISVFSFEVK